MKTDFEDYKDNYKEEVQSSISFIKQDVDFFTEAKARYLIEIAQRQFDNLGELDVLDVGCGVGETDRFLTSRFKTLHGIDIAEGVMDKAKTNNPSAYYRLYNGHTIPYPDNTFDLVFAICVMHHIPPGNWQSFISEMKRVTKNGGLVIIFEHNPLNPLTRMAVDRCEFDADANLLRRGKVRDLFEYNEIGLAEQQYILFFPWKQRIFSSIERGLTWLPLGAQYYIAGKK